MAKNIPDALAALALTQAANAATLDGREYRIKRVWAYSPPMSKSIQADTPAWINTFTFTRRPSGSTMRTLHLSVRSQLYVHDADQDRGLEIATRMFADMLDRLDHNVTLKDADGQPTVTRLDYRGADPTLGLGERGGLAYQMVDMWIDLMIQEAFIYA